MSIEPEHPTAGPNGETAAGTGTPTPETPQTPEQLMQAASARIAELEGELADMKERWMRAEAETANVRARAKRDVDETRQYAVQKFATDVVEAAENLRRGLDSLPASEPGEPAIVTKLREGFEGVERSFLALLERNGIKNSDPTGAVFDPNLHQAMAEQESEAHPPGTVMHAWSQAMVVVAKAPPAELTAETSKLNTSA